MNRKPGFTLVEVIVAIAILAVIGVAFLSGMTTAFKSNILADSKTNAAAIAQSQLEYLKEKPYETAPNDENYPGVMQSRYDSITSPDGYQIYSYDYNGGEPILGVIGIPINTEDGSYSETDNGIQVIKLVIMQDNKIVYTLETYKVR